MDAQEIGKSRSPNNSSRVLQPRSTNSGCNLGRHLDMDLPLHAELIALLRKLLPMLF